MKKILKGFNVIAVQDKDKERFGGIYLAALSGLKDSDKEDKRMNVPIDENPQLVSAEDKEIFKKVWEKALKEFKRVTDLGQNKSKKAPKKSLNKSKKKKTKKSKIKKTSKKKSK